MELLSTNSLTILAGTGLFFVLAMLLVIVLLVAKKYLVPSGNVMELLWPSGTSTMYSSAGESRNPIPATPPRQRKMATTAAAAPAVHNSAFLNI